MSWNQWLTSWLTCRTSGGRWAMADQAAALCEERAWSLVEERVMCLAPHELRGYVRARTRGLLESSLLALPESFAALRREATFRSAVASCLLNRLSSRVGMVQADLGYRHAA